MLIFLAKVVSRLFGPMFWLLVIFILFFEKTNLTMREIKILLPTLFFLEAIFPGLYLILGYFKKKIHDFDITKREERLGIFSFTFGSYLLSLVVVWFCGSMLAFKFQLSLVLVMGLVVMITYWWKISVHMAINTTAMVLLNYLFAWQLWPLFFLLPIVAWARIVLRKHTWQQLLIGTLTGLFAFLPLYFL